MNQDFPDVKSERKQKFNRKRNPLAKDLLTNGLYRAKRVESKIEKSKHRRHLSSRDVDKLMNYEDLNE